MQVGAAPLQASIVFAAPGMSITSACVRPMHRIESNQSIVAGSPIRPHGEPDDH